MTRSARWAVIAALVFGGCFDGVSSSGGGCGGFGPPDGEPFDLGDAQEDPGPALVTLDSGSSFAFTPDGGEIVYPAYTETRDLGNAWPEPLWALRSVRLSDGTRRDLSDVPMDSAQRYALTPDGAALYYLAYDASASTKAVLREAYSRTNVVLEGRSPLAFAVSTDSATLLIDTVQSPEWGSPATVLVDGPTGRSVSTPCATTSGAAFSPAGDELLCQQATGDGVAWRFARYALPDGVAQPLPGLPGCGWELLTRWTPEGIVGACQRAGGTLVLGDVQTGAELASADAGGQAQGLVLSPGGDALAFAAADRCLAGWLRKDGAGVLACTRWEWQVKVLDRTTSAITTIATSGSSPGTLAFSADGKTLAYLLGATIHVRPTRP